MGRKKLPTPTYRRHRQYGYSSFTDADGVRRHVRFPGYFGSEESRRAYANFILNLGAPERPSPKLGGACVAEVLSAYLDHAERHYLLATGRHSSEYRESRLVAQKANELFGDSLADEFGPLKAKAIRQAWVDDGLSRSECNRRTRILIRIFRWAAAEELVAEPVARSLAILPGLQKGRSAAPETRPIEPVEDPIVERTLPFLSASVAAMVRFQRKTGCRPGEACSLRMCDVSTDAEIWIFRPPSHKTEHLGHARMIAIGPSARAAIEGILPDDPTAYVFRPARGRSKRYTSASYSRAVSRACERAFPLPLELQRLEGESAVAWRTRLTSAERKALDEWTARHHWAPNRLRHTYLTEVRAQFGLEAAQAVAGHSHADVTQVYAARHDAMASAVAAKIG